MTKLGMKIYLHDGTEILTHDALLDEEAVIEQMTNYGTYGYYSRAKKVYYPPSSIKYIQMITLEDNSW